MRMKCGSPLRGLTENVPLQNGHLTWGVVWFLPAMVIAAVKTVFPSLVHRLCRRHCSCLPSPLPAQSGALCHRLRV